MAGALLLQRLVAEPARALALSRMADVLAKYEGLSRLLALRLQQEQNYLAKLEGQKVRCGSSAAWTEGCLVWLACQVVPTPVCSASLIDVDGRAGLQGEQRHLCMPRSLEGGRG